MAPEWGRTFWRTMKITWNLNIYGPITGALICGLIGMIKDDWVAMAGGFLLLGIAAVFAYTERTHKQ